MPAARTAPPDRSPRRWSLHGAAGPADVEVRAAAETELGAVRDGLAGCGLPSAALWSGSDRLDDRTPLSDPRLRHGAQLGVDRPGPRGTPAGGALELQVTGGPGAGACHPLAQGALVVGRGHGAGAPRVLLPDPAVSRAHLEVAVTGTGVVVRDLGSANGSRLARSAAAGGGDRELGPDPVPWPLGAAVRAGASTLRLVAPGGSTLPVGPAPGGRWLTAPPARPAPPAVPAVVVTVPGAPEPPARRALAWIAVLLPALAGGVLAWVLGTPTFLFFALLGPVVALGGWASDRWSGRRGHRRRTAEHAADLARADAEVAAAVAAEVGLREQLAPDPAGLVSAARRRSAPLWERPATDPDLLVVRLGTGPGPTGVSRRRADGAPAPVEADRLPVRCDLREGGLEVRGPRPARLGALRALVCQVAVLHPPDAVALTVLTGPAETPDWRWARWLPHLRPAAGGADPGGAHLVVVDGALDDAAVEHLHRARRAGAVVVGQVPGGGATALLEVVGETGDRARLRRSGHPDQDLVLDLLAPELAEQVAADLAPLTVPRGPGDLPDDVRRRDLPGAVPAVWSRSRAHLSAVLGAGSTGPVTLDLCAAGPHALVAGTTGAGKSELLRTLVLGLAAAHPPDRCSFLLVDYKGGAAFGEAAELPHTVGLLTDLDGASTARALRSLAAELTRRERVLAEHGARDLADLPGSADGPDDVLLPRLVIVVDEFATLGEELPGFVPGLVSIAQRGRSLGVHLVLATQRPSGSVSPEIRANCTVRLCLRTTDETGSRDVLGVPDAAWLPVDRPGRALLRVGAEPPVVLQVARVGVPADGPGEEVVVRRWPAPPGPVPVTAAPPRTSDLAAEVHALRARAAGLPPPPRPWLPALPDRVDPLPAPGGADHPARVRWGLVDRPDVQAQEPLVVDLDAGGSWLVVGGPRSGRTTALRTLLAEAVGALSPAELHVHAVDQAGGELARAVAGLPHCGTVVGRGAAHRSQRLVVRLQEEVDRRRSVPGPHPRLLLLVDGVDPVTAELEELAPGSGGAALLRLVREGGAVGLTAVLTADRALPGSRLASAAGHRLVLPLADAADYAVAGVPAARLPAHRPPGRALLDDDATEVQLALPRTVRPGPAGAVVPGRVEVVELPADPAAPTAPGLEPGTVVLGPGGDGGDPVVVDLRRAAGLLVTGPPGSGRSSALAAVASRLAGRGTPVLLVGPPRRRTATVPSGTVPSGTVPSGVGAVQGPAGVPVDDPAVLQAWADGLDDTAGGVVVADDLGQLPDALLDALAAVTGPGCAAVLVAAAAPGDVAGAYRGPLPALRRTRTALLLQPARGDGELLGLRLPRAPLPARPGAGWLVTGGTTTRVQVARR
ncbi:FtsK/SpoIIIE domain-containing protein [Klenkia taihuensis]|uniref:DNA segregation ATPase FtsK/SpoIIIE, S-DNA-T family n=1 Tax=Klenkia taihuensis TaxID=1225127 RepID=A0A1I1K291_9ACTN|nr:FtsK/SpoIIIE domain-containing protein [Klenkia taihuensis]GHE10550.1 hypothetical protein GCM10011381_20120 [Klenkia taihuensis]SFC54964.1 DNA segregation ATPase FtsK/SpoIIIE, S-DNA-T family [Klenkia taihuensis]